ncbi:MAG: M48 family metallopeptidase [Sandaracinaceae bacterium]|nr:M48 family metallopeptidase [Sandaracinaceae bacterium]
MSDTFSFGEFVDRQKNGAYGRHEGARYAYAADLAMLRGFSRIRPVELAAATVVRMNKEFLRGTLLGQTVKVTERQFPSLYKLVERCARTLQVPVPQVYVANSPVMNAFTFGTEDDSFIVLHSALVDSFSEKELLFVIGHETGHIQNKHVVYNTALILLQRMAELFIGPLVLPAVVALNAWYRRAEITCDRAGLLCSQDLDSASRSFIKLAVGSKRLSDEVDMSEFLAQHDEAQSSVGRYMEAFQSHPYLPKRIKALQVFADSELYRGAIGQSGGLDIDEVDQRTSAIISMDGKEGSST